MRLPIAALLASSLLTTSHDPARAADAPAHRAAAGTTKPAAAAKAAAPKPAAEAAKKKTDPDSLFRSGTFSGLAFRSLGPAVTSGRVGDVAVDPVHPDTWFVAAASGGLWKTDNAATTW